MNPNSVLTKIRKASTPVDSVPREFKTDTEWARQWRFCPSHARKLLFEGTQAGVMVRKRFRIRVGGFCRMTWHYAEAKKTKRR